MVKKYKLTVITVNFNNAAGLEKTFKSVRQQSNQNFEYVVVDGNSSDSSLAIIQRYSDIIHLWKSEKDNGVYDAMNKALRMARGDYVMFLNSGDTFFNHVSMENILSINFTEDFVYGDVCIDYGYKKSIRTYPDRLGLWFLYSEMICHQVQLIKTKVLKRLGGFDTRVAIVADYDVMIHALVRKKASYRHIPNTLAVYAWGGASTQPAAAATIQHGKALIRKKYFDPKVLEVLLEVEVTTFRKYQSVVQSRAYQVFRIFERMPLTLFLLDGLAKIFLWLRLLLSRIRSHKPARPEI